MDTQRSLEGAGTRTFVVGIAALASILVIGFAIRASSPRLLLEKLSRSDVHTPAAKIGSAVSAPSEAISGAVKHNPGGQEDTVGGGGRVNKRMSSEPINLTEAQRATLHSIFASVNQPKVDQPNFELMIGAALAKRTPLADLPPEVPKVLNGFSGDQYVIVGEDLVIMDQHSHRVAAIINNVK